MFWLSSLLVAILLLEKEILKPSPTKQAEAQSPGKTGRTTPGLLELAWSLFLLGAKPYFRSGNKP